MHYFLGQGSNPCPGRDPNRYRDNAGSLTHCTTRELQKAHFLPAPLHWHSSAWMKHTEKESHPSSGPVESRHLHLLSPLLPGAPSSSAEHGAAPCPALPVPAPNLPPHRAPGHQVASPIPLTSMCPNVCTRGMTSSSFRVARRRISLISEGLETETPPERFSASPPPPALPPASGSWGPLLRKLAASDSEEPSRYC